MLILSLLASYQQILLRQVTLMKTVLFFVCFVWSIFRWCNLSARGLSPSYYGLVLWRHPVVKETYCLRVGIFIRNKTIWTFKCNQSWSDFLFMCMTEWINWRKKCIFIASIPPICVIFLLIGYVCHLNGINSVYSISSLPATYQEMWLFVCREETRMNSFVICGLYLKYLSWLFSACEYFLYKTSEIPP